MDIGNLPNYKFYNGYEGEPEIAICLDGNESLSIHVWEGYFADILRAPNLNGQGWTGFTRDYHQCEGAFAEEGVSVQIEIDEYLNDLKQYVGMQFKYTETTECLDLLCGFLNKAKSNHHSVSVIVL